MSKGDSKHGERSEYVQLRQIAADLPIGHTEHRIKCPFCRGGRNGDSGFSITRISEAEARYCCHRATCSRSGRVAAWGFRLHQEETGAYSSPKKREFTPRLYSGNSSELDKFWLSDLLDIYELSSEEADWASWREDIDSKRLICPIISPISVLRGYELRQRKRSLVLDKPERGPKTSHYKSIDEVWMGWYRRLKSGPVLLVEDVISALKGSRHFQTASLMGSHVSLEHLVEAIEIAGDNPIFLALDKDATDKAFKFISQWRFIAPNFRACPLSKDLKYLSDNEIISVIS